MRANEILLVDDDQDLLKILSDNLEMDGFPVRVAATGKKAMEQIESETPSLVILDLTLPDMDGIQVCRLIRQKCRSPIIMLTARDGTSDKVLGLESGADDYVVKPFEYLELAARIKAHLRRSGPYGEYAEVIRAGDLKIDTNLKSVRKGGRELSLTLTEFEILALLARNKDRVLSRETIKQQIWDDDALYKKSRVIDVHIQHLRSKLDDDPETPKYIKTVPGVGYTLKIEEN